MNNSEDTVLDIEINSDGVVSLGRGLRVAPFKLVSDCPTKTKRIRRGVAQLSKSVNGTPYSPSTADKVLLELEQLYNSVETP